MVSDEVLAFDVVVLAEQLQELEGPHVSANAGLGVDLFVRGFRLEDILAVDVLLVDFIEIIVVDCGDGESVLLIVFLLGRLLDVLHDELS